MTANDPWGIFPTPCGSIALMDWASKWIVRKRDGLWRMWRPHENDPFVAFDHFPTCEEAITARSEARWQQHQVHPEGVIHRQPEKVAPAKIVEHLKSLEVGIRESIKGRVSELGYDYFTLEAQADGIATSIATIKNLAAEGVLG